MTNFLFGQGKPDVLNTTINANLIPNNATIEVALNAIELQHDITFSYSANQFDLQSIIKNKGESLSLRRILKDIFYRYNIQLKSVENKVIITGSIKKIRIYGFIRDKSSGETLAGALIINQSSQEIHSPNAEGYYSLTISSEEAILETRVLGYMSDSLIITNDGADIQKDINLMFNNSLGTITIRRNVQDNLIFDPGGTIVTIDKIYGNKGLSGEEDIVHSIKMTEGVTSGTEGVLGLHVNGGSSDQNLVLLDGMPLYEISHIGGINSIFLNESIQSVNLIKTGIPARYGGRLSSVLNVRLKEGHIEKPKRSISLGISGANFGFEGPLGKNNNTTFNLSARTSLLNYSIGPFVDKFTNFRKVIINFHDAVGKITHRFNKKSKISLTAYIGGDRIKMVKDDTLSSANQFYVSKDINELRWGNKLISINYDKIISSKMNLSFQAGWNSYNYYSRGYYELVSQSDSIDINETIDVTAYSGINDLQAVSTINYYLNDAFKMKFGLGAIRHSFSPSVRQSLVSVNEDINNFESPDSAIQTAEFFSFAEINIQLGKYIYLYPGLHINNYFVEKTRYLTLQPRARILIVPESSTIISIAYSRMAQNLHLLSNPGLGLASDLWVPSTNVIKPSISNQIDLEFKQTITTGINISASWYNKDVTNITEYSVPIDLLANLVNQNQIEVFLTKESDWRNQVEIGSGKSNGFTLAIKKEAGKLKGWVSYHRNSSKRQFTNLNDGEVFSARHERPNDINIALNYEFTKNLVLGANWIYTSGGTFSLPNEKFKSNIDITLLRPNGRNNFRLPAYHQLTINGEYTFKMFNTSTHLNFGIYNIYNRLNPFYIYATNNPGSTVPALKKVSIFPILPFANLTWRW